MLFFILFHSIFYSLTHSPSNRNLITQFAGAKLNFGIYDFDGSGKVDCKWLADLLRSLDLRPTNAACKKVDFILGFY